MSAHRWGPVVRFGSHGRMLTRCLNGFCVMDLSVDDVPAKDQQDAAEFLRQMQSHADSTHPCPTKAEDLAAYMRLDS